MSKQTIENIKTSYKYYRGRDIENLVLRDVYYKVTQDFMKFILNEVLEGKEVELPCRTGYMFIQGVKGSYPTDWKTTLELWRINPEMAAKKQRIYLINEHTNLVAYRYTWSKKDIYCIHKEFYHFTLTKQNRMKMRSLILKGSNYRIKQKVEYGNRTQISNKEKG